MIASALLAVLPPAVSAGAQEASDGNSGAVPGMIGHPIRMSVPRSYAPTDGLEIRVGDAPAYLSVSADGQIEFEVPAVDPGSREVQIRTPGGLWETAGMVDVAKAALPPADARVVDGVVLVRLVPGVTTTDVALHGDSFDALVPETDDPVMSRWWVVSISPDSTVSHRIVAYAEHAGVEVATFDAYGESARSANDPFYGTSGQYNLSLARLTALWEIRTAAAGVRIAVIDSGTRWSHEDLVVDALWDFTGTGHQPCNFHGSHVAGIAAARSDNGRGIAGAAWGATVGSFKVHSAQDGRCIGTAADVAAAIDAARGAGYEIINMSLGGPDNIAAVQDAVNQAWNAGVFLVASAGNGNTSMQSFPAAHNNVFAVANTTAADTRSSTSNYGGWVDLAAPGTSIVSAGSGSDTQYVTATGTSMASPLVAGAAALLRAHGHGNAAIRDRLLAHGDLVNWDPTRSGERRLNAYAALDPAMGCLRDIPDGAFVGNDTGTVWVVDGVRKRHVPDLTVLNSWRGRNDVVRLCPNRLKELSNGATWGYRPGTLVRSPSTGAVYLVGTTGTLGTPPKRHITSWSVAKCYGWDLNTMVISGTDSALDQLPTGSPISSCNPGLRTFPDGSLVLDPNGVASVIDAGQRRHVVDPTTRDMWFTRSHFVPITAVESALVPAGPDWGMRPGRLVQQSGQAAQYVITGTGTRYAAGQRRHLVDGITKRERGWNPIPLTDDVTASTISLHGIGTPLRNADDLP